MPSLPNELYLQIASYLEYASHISSLMQTTKRLYHLLTPVLYDFVFRRYYAVEILIWAAEHGHTRVIQKMLDGGVLKRTSASDGWKMIKLAVMNRHAAVVDQLQQNGIEDVIRPSEVEWVYPKCLISGRVGCKLLGLALQYADESVLRVLVEHEITKGTTAKAGSCRDLSVDKFIKLHLLRAAGMKHPVQDEIPLHSAGSRNDTAAFRAALCGSVSAVKQILEEGSHGDTKPWGSRTFLHDKTYELQLPLAHAAKWEHMDVVALMLDYGADPSASGRAIWSGVLESAIGSGNIETVKLLLDRGIGVDFQRGEPHCKPSLGVNALGSAVRFLSIFDFLSTEAH
ncbi:hypothetical protein SI65_06339 [Aspergillus cristatus]|uniref:F-box domain-containing protein n=1 Tax=Aspergillus cristatus TaxID=573508 RepID=A0A1E3BC55_ASPCR|nr:hypothetical protein SI65_06339 [Aspergillus cristatus]